MEVQKPTVKYRPDVSDYIVKGQSALVYVLDHPYAGPGHVSTSKVIRVGAFGQFETANTLYVPE